jgi:hypothetical protein
MSTLISDEQEETILSVRLDNAKRDVLCGLDLLYRAVQAARAAGRTELAADLCELYLDQQSVAARLISVAKQEQEPEAKFEARRIQEQL